MALLIDGYNLLHASGILGRGIGPGGLERSRNALLSFLVESLEAVELSRTIVVFDAREAPPGLPRTVQHRGLTVRFADPGSDADQLIEELVRLDTSPRKLIVVSSDHRLHRAARRRRARAIDSDQWYAQTLRRRMDRWRQHTTGLKPEGPSSDVEVRFWLKQFGIEQPEPQPPRGDPRSPADSPFPPGYGEDITEDDV